MKTVPFDSSVQDESNGTIFVLCDYDLTYLFILLGVRTLVGGVKNAMNQVNLVPLESY